MSGELTKTKDLSRTEKAAIIQVALRKEGFIDADIAKLMNVSRNRVCNVNKKIKTGTLNPLVAKAKKAVKSILEGHGIGDMREVKGSDVLTAAKMVLDRSDPIVQKSENTNISYKYELKDEDRDRYKKALGIIDAEYEVLPEQVKQIEYHEITEQVTDTVSQDVQDSPEPSSYD